MFDALKSFQEEKKSTLIAYNTPPLEKHPLGLEETKHAKGNGQHYEVLCD